jgi:hypothetical protein
MAYTYGQGLGNTGAAYNLWGTPSGSPNPYYSAGPSYTPSLFDYSVGQPQAQTQQNTQSLTPMNRPTEDMTAKEMAWWAERLGLGGLLRMGSTDGSGVPIEDRIIGGQESPFLSPDAQRAQTFDAQPPAVMGDSTSPYITSLLQEAPTTYPNTPPPAILNPLKTNRFLFDELNSQFPEANRDYYINEIDFSSPEIRGAYAEDHYSNVFEQPTVYDPFNWF